MLLFGNLATLISSEGETYKEREMRGPSLVKIVMVILMVAGLMLGLSNLFPSIESVDDDKTLNPIKQGN